MDLSPKVSGSPSSSSLHPLPTIILSPFSRHASSPLPPNHPHSHHHHHHFRLPPLPHFSTPHLLSSPGCLSSSHGATVLRSPLSTAAYHSRDLGKRDTASCEKSPVADDVPVMLADPPSSKLQCDGDVSRASVVVVRSGSVKPEEPATQNGGEVESGSEIKQCEERRSEERQLDVKLPVISSRTAPKKQHTTPASAPALQREVSESITESSLCDYEETGSSLCDFEETPLPFSNLPLTRSGKSRTPFKVGTRLSLGSKTKASSVWSASEATRKPAAKKSTQRKSITPRKPAAKKPGIFYAGREEARKRKREETTPANPKPMQTRSRVVDSSPSRV